MKYEIWITTYKCRKLFIINDISKQSYSHNWLIHVMAKLQHSATQIIDLWCLHEWFFKCSSSNKSILNVNTFRSQQLGLLSTTLATMTYSSQECVQTLREVFFSIIITSITITSITISCFSAVICNMSVPPIPLRFYTCPIGLTHHF